MRRSPVPADVPTPEWEVTLGRALTGGRFFFLAEGTCAGPSPASSGRRTTRCAEDVPARSAGVIETDDGATVVLDMRGTAAPIHRRPGGGRGRHPRVRPSRLPALNDSLPSVRGGPAALRRGDRARHRRPGAVWEPLEGRGPGGRVSGGRPAGSGGELPAAGRTPAASGSASGSTSGASSVSSAVPSRTPPPDATTRRGRPRGRTASAATSRRTYRDSGCAAISRTRPSPLPRRATGHHDRGQAPAGR